MIKFNNDIQINKGIPVIGVLRRGGLSRHIHTGVVDHFKWWFSGRHRSARIIHIYKSAI